MENHNLKPLLMLVYFCWKNDFAMLLKRGNSKGNTINTEPGIRSLYLNIGLYLSRFAVCYQQLTSYLIWKYINQNN